MKLMEILREDLIKVGLKAADKWEAIQELVDLAVERGKIKEADRDRVIEAVLDRERSMSTGMQHGVAIPHSAVEGLDDIVGTLGIQRKGIPFDSVDGEPASLIILLVYPRAKVQAHVRTLAGIARVLNDQDMIKALKSVKTSKDAIKVIEAEEKQNLFAV